MKFFKRFTQIELDRGKGNGSRKRLIVISSVALVVVVIAAVGIFGTSEGSEDVMAVAVQSEPFAAIVVERGELRAANTVTYNAPRLRRGGSQTILEMAPEGIVVQPGDLVVQFDSNSLLESITGKEDEVEQIESQLEKTRAQQESNMASLQASLEKTQHSHEQARLNIEAMEFESQYRRIQEEYSFKKSELALERAVEAIDTQKRLDEASIQQIQQRLDRARRELADMRIELDQTTLYAEQPGLVIYEKTFGQSGESKMSVGSSPYGGQAVISIPDLTTMIVEIGISELDIRRVGVGQMALVRVDAYPDTLYAAQIVELSPLARRAGMSQMKMFDCIVQIEGTDLRLRPGMTAQVSVITHYEPEALVVPMEAVFRSEDKTIVFARGNGGGFEAVEVVLGAENGNYYVIEEGLEAGTLVALRDPFIKLEELETAGADALLQTRQRMRGGGGAMGIEQIRMFMGGGGGGRGGRGGGPSMRTFR